MANQKIIKFILKINNDCQELTESNDNCKRKQSNYQNKIE